MNDRYMKNFFCSAMTAALILVVLGSGSAVQAAPKPNIVFILADDMSRDTWGAYGSIDCKTPNIDQLARDGVRFDRAYCTASMCSPFRMELYSGRTPWRTGTLPNHSNSTPGTKSIVHYLTPLGYRVGLVGKGDVRPQEAYPFEGPSDWTKGDSKLKDPHLKNAFAFIDSCTSEDKPFCIFIASHDSHDPYTNGDPSVYNAASFTIPPYWLDTPELREQLTRYYAEISNFDALVGEARQELEKRGLLENTILMVCSEQGTSMPFAKWTCYDNGLHTGLVAYWNGVTKPGSVIDELISMADVTPTLVDAAGGVLQQGDCDGESFLAMLKGEKQAGRKYVYGAFTNRLIADNAKRVYPIRSIRDKNYALIYNPNYTSKTSNVLLTGALDMLEGREPEERDVGTSWVELAKKDPKAKELVHKLHNRPEYELYDLRKDPYELKNEIDNPEYKEVAERLKKLLMQRLHELGDADPMATEKGLVKANKKGSIE